MVNIGQELIIGVGATILVGFLSTVLYYLNDIDVNMKDNNRILRDISSEVSELNQDTSDIKEKLILIENSEPGRGLATQSNDAIVNITDLQTVNFKPEDNEESESIDVRYEIAGEGINRSQLNTTVYRGNFNRFDEINKELDNITQKFVDEVGEFRTKGDNQFRYQILTDSEGDLRTILEAFQVKLEDNVNEWIITPSDDSDEEYYSSV